MVLSLFILFGLTLSFQNCSNHQFNSDQEGTNTTQGGDNGIVHTMDLLEQKLSKANQPERTVLECDGREIAKGAHEVRKKLKSLKALLVVCSRLILLIDEESFDIRKLLEIAEDETPPPPPPPPVEVALSCRGKLVKINDVIGEFAAKFKRDEKGNLWLNGKLYNLNQSNLIFSNDPKNLLQYVPKESLPKNDCPYCLGVKWSAVGGKFENDSYIKFGQDLVKIDINKNQTMNFSFRGFGNGEFEGKGECVSVSSASSTTN